MNSIRVGDRGTFRMWNRDTRPITGTVEEIKICHDGETRVIFKRDDYRETVDCDGEHFRQWFTPFTAENIRRQFSATSETR